MLFKKSPSFSLLAGPGVSNILPAELMAIIPLQLAHELASWMPA
jgi:hypothetical protein